MEATDVEQPKTDTVEKEVTTEDYLKEKFPCSVGEYQVNYKPVGENKFRINFWSYTPESENKFMRGSRITRSHYVVLKKEGQSWSHTIV